MTGNGLARRESMGAAEAVNDPPLPLALTTSVHASSTCSCQELHPLV